MNNVRNRIHIFAAVIILAMVSMACGFNLKSPVTQIKTGPLQTVDIRVPMQGAASTGLELNLEFLAGKMKLTPGGNEYLTSGTAIYNAAEFEPIVKNNGSSFTVRQGVLEFKGIPTFKDDVINEWDLQIANIPLSLNIKAGAYSGNLELGGLSLEKLTISEGGSNLMGSFSKPNNVKMSSFTFSTGGSTTVLKGLANANFEQMTFSSGAGDYTLSFDGELQRNAAVTIETGASTVNIIFPPGVDAQLTFDGGLTSVKAEAGWSQNGNLYTHSGSGPTISITVKMGLGTLNLKNL